MANFFAHVGAFDPTNQDDDINGWLDRFDACCQLNNIASSTEGMDDASVLPDNATAGEKNKERQRRAFLISEGGPTAFAVLKNKVVPPATPYQTPSFSLRKILREHFNPPHSQEAAMVELDRRLQGKDEKVSDYVLAIQRIAVKCNFSAEEYQSKLLYKMKTGVRCKHARLKMKGEQNLTYDNAVRIAVDAEVVAAQDEVIQKQFQAHDEHGKVDEDKESVQKVNSFRGRGGQQQGRGGGQVFPRGRGRGFPPFQGSNFRGNYQGGYPGGYSSGYSGGYRGGYRGTYHGGYQGQRGGQSDRSRGNFSSTRGRGGFQQNQQGQEFYQPQQRQCYACGSTQHIQRFCPEVCWNCGGRGHKSNQCSSNFGDTNNNSNGGTENSQETGEGKVALVHEDDSGAYYEDMYGEGWVPGMPETVGKIFSEGTEVPENARIELSDLELSKCFMEIEVDNNNNVSTPNVVKEQVQYVENRVLNLNDNDDGVWYDVEGNTWRQECDKYVELRELPTIASDLVYFEIVAQVRSQSTWVESKAVNVFVNINDQRLKMSIDSGSKETLIPIFIFKDFFRCLRLTPSKVMLTSVEGECIKVVGECVVQVRDTKGKIHDLLMTVVDSRSLKVPLLGRRWLDAICPGWREKLCSMLGQISDSVFLVEETSKTVIELRKLFPKVFSKDKNSAIEGFQADIMVNEKAKPMMSKEYPIPFYLRDRVVKKLWEDVESGKARIVTKPKWASPMFAIEKPNKDVRIIIDFKKTVNPQLKMDYFPMPNPADLWGLLDADADCFVKLDCSEAYKQMRVSEESKQFLVANTPIGFLEYQFLCFGLANAPALFQHMMYVILKGIPGVWNFLDDTIIWGRDKTECRQRLIQVLTRLEEHNVKINETKCEWFKREVTYLGFMLDKGGRHILMDRIRPILEAPVPKNVQQLRSYLGTFNVYKSFLPDTSILLKPLYELLQAYKMYKWTGECQQAFEQSKRMLLSHRMLVHYNPKLPLVLITDASPYGVSAVLCHRVDGVDRPIMCASSSLDETQQRYSQIEREGLAVIYGIDKFYKYLAGRQFTLVIDNVPLQYIFSPEKGIPTLAASRLQHWAAKLSTFNYKIECRKSSEMGLVDALSRLPLPENDVKNIETEMVCNINVLHESPLNYEVVGHETSKDPILQKVLYHIVKGWPEKCPEKGLEPYFINRVFLSVDQECVMFGDRVVIPKALQKRVLNRLHDGHPGIVRSKMLARTTLWWPGISSDIDSMGKKCTVCNLVNFRPVSSATIPWPDPGEPWVRVHMDFFDFKTCKFFVLEDAYTKWTMIWHMPDKTDAKHVIVKLEEVVALFGPPEMLVCDNGPPFDSMELANYCTQNLIVLKNVPKYHPESNGQAERMVQTVKRKFKAFLLSDDAEKFVNIQEKINLFLRTYRNTPSTATGTTPNKLMLAKCPRTPMSVLRPPGAQKRFPLKPMFNPDDHVWCKFSKAHSVVEGKIVRPLGPTVYLVYVNGEVIPVSVNQLRLRYVPEVRDNAQEPTHVEQGRVSAPAMSVPVVSEVRRSVREKKVPKKMDL